MSDAPVKAMGYPGREAEPRQQAREPWVRPELTELPPLSQLTLQSPVGDPIDGGGDDTGGTVF